MWCWQSPYSQRNVSEGCKEQRGRESGRGDVGREQEGEKNDLMCEMNTFTHFFLSIFLTCSEKKKRHFGISCESDCAGRCHCVEISGVKNYTHVHAHT